MNYVATLFVRLTAWPITLFESIIDLPVSRADFDDIGSSLHDLRSRVLNLLRNIKSNIIILKYNIKKNFF